MQQRSNGTLGHPPSLSSSLPPSLTSTPHTPPLRAPLQGIGELLEILGSIINGFAIPLKKEHTQFLQRALIPLHIPKCVGLYHQQLSYCIIQYIEKDPDTAIVILRGLFKYWPWSSSAKQVDRSDQTQERERDAHQQTSTDREIDRPTD